MQRTTLSGMIIGLLLLCCGGVVLASEADELRERAKALRKKASISADQGRPDQAERLERESAELLEAAKRMELKNNGNGDKRDRPGVDKEVHHLKERLQDLRAKEQKMRAGKAPDQELAQVREQISGTERELKQVHEHQTKQSEHRPEFHKQAEKLEIATRRIHHLRVAAENLKLAEEHELARKLLEQAMAMERDVQEAKQRLAAEMHKGQERQEDYSQGQDVVRELKEEIQRLRTEVKELSQKIEKH